MKQQGVFFLKLLTVCVLFLGLLFLEVSERIKARSFGQLSGKSETLLAPKTLLTQKLVDFADGR